MGENRTAAPTIRARHRGKEYIMDFAILLVLSNTLMAVLIYIIVKFIWQD
jgi:hypothetical protein